MAIARFYPGMFIEFCEEAGIKTPAEPDEEFDQIEYPYFKVFITVHCGKAFTEEQISRNAKIIASLSEEEIKTITLAGLKEKGLDYNYSRYWD